MLLSEFRDKLLTLNIKLFHFEASDISDQYLVWAEQGQSDASYKDNKMSLQIIDGTLDYFTRVEYDDNIGRIQSVLNDGIISWELNSIQYEPATKLIHYEWYWKLVDPFG